MYIFLTLVSYWCMQDVGSEADNSYNHVEKWTQLASHLMYNGLDSEGTVCDAVIAMMLHLNVLVYHVLD